MARPDLPADDYLLTRDAFRWAVFARANERCVLCGAPATDAHHILDRKLYPDGGYYLGNGAAVCGTCHLDCETTQVNVAAVRAAAGIHQPVLPPGLAEAVDYDKWGNQCWPSGMRPPGPLGQDEGMRRALARGGFLGWLVPPGYCE